MNRNNNTPRSSPDTKPGQPSYESQPDMTPRREGGDDTIAESLPTDSRLDEKVIVNEQRGNKTVNAPSQTAANTSESNNHDEEILDDSDTTDE